MKAREYAELTTTELPDELLFRVVRHTTFAGWAKWSFHRFLTLTPAVGFIILYGLWRRESTHWMILGLIAGAYTPVLTRLNYGPVTTLRVTSRGLTAAGNLGNNIFPKKVTAPWTKVRLFEWHEGGLTMFPRSQWKSTICVLPGLNKEQAKLVRIAIFERFPEIVQQIYLEKGEPDKTPASFSFGDHTGLITLGLAASQPKLPDTEA